VDKEKSMDCMGYIELPEGKIAISTEFKMALQTWTQQNRRLGNFHNFKELPT